MKIVISSQGKEKNNLMDSRFGRCAYFYIYDTKTEKAEVVENEAVNSSGGAGIQAANLVVEKDIDVVITGNLGPNAIKVLKESNIKVLTSEIKPISNILDDYKEEKLKPLDY